jgi:Ca-activated chloride channel family protein
MMSMRFADPNWLWIGALACSLTTLLVLWDKRRRARALARFLAARHVRQATQQVSWRMRAVKHALAVLGVACLFFALARPQWGYHFEVQRRQGIELMFAVDTSKSMLAQDLRPSRLERAKLAVQDLLRKLPNDPAGLVVFAGDAFLQTPVTLDRVAFQQALSTLAADVIPVPGTNLERAIRVAEQAFANAGDKRKILVLLTDGEALEGSALDAARQAAQHGLTIHTIGIGTPQGGTIAVRDEHGGVSLVRDASGAVVHSKLDESTLRQVAALSGGSYHALGADGRGLAALYAERLAKLPAHTIETRMHKVFHERFQWPLSAAMALLLAAWLLRDHRRGRPQPRAAVAAALLALASFSPSAHAQAHEPVDTYNQAAARYRAGHFEEAAHDYDAALASRDLTLQERAYYDRGNALYRVGQAASDKQQQIDRYKRAVASYEAALALQPHDADAKYNHDFVKRKLEQLEQEQATSAPKPDPKQGQGDPKQTQGKDRSGQQRANAGDQGAPEPRQGGDQQARANAGGQGERQQAQASAASAQRQAGGQQANAGDPGAPEQPPANGQQTADANGASAPPTDDAVQTDADAAAGADGGEHEPAGARARPGALTRRESARLLDALQGELRRLPSSYADNAGPRHDRARKDW